MWGFNLMPVLLAYAANIVASQDYLKNILLIISDDLRYNRDDPLRHTPNLDAFAADSVDFNFAYTQIPNCNPSRASILTGMRPDNNRVWDLAGQNFRERGLMRSGPDVVTLPQYLKESGLYWTVSLSKVFHLGDSSGSEGRSCPLSGQDLPYSFDKVWKCSGKANLLSPPIYYYVNTNGARPAGCPDVDEYEFSIEANNGCYQSQECQSCLSTFECQNTWEATCPAECPDECFIDYLAANATNDFIDEFFDEKLPSDANNYTNFFIAAGIAKPHLPWNIPYRVFEQYFDIVNDFANVSLPQETTPPKNMPQWSAGWGYPPGSIEMLNTADSSGEGFVYTVENTTWKGWSSTTDSYPLSHMNAEYSRRLRAGYYASVAYLDEQIGRMLDHLKEKGIYNDTIIIITSDHGYSVGEMGFWNKHTQFEQDLRTPLFMRFPGMEYSYGKTINTPVELLDIYPTIIEATLRFDINGDVIRQIDGKSLLPLIESLEFDPDQEFVDDDEYYAYSQITRATEGVYPFNSGIMGVTIRTKNYRYTEWLDFEDGDGFTDTALNEYVIVNGPFAEWAHEYPYGDWGSELYIMTNGRDTNLAGWNENERQNVAYEEEYKALATEMHYLLHTTWNNPPMNFEYKRQKFEFVTIEGYYTDLASVPVNLVDPIVISVDHSGFYIFGGVDADQNNALNVEVYKYVVADDEWMKLPENLAEWNFQGNGRIAEVYSGRIYTYGGNNHAGNKMIEYYVNDYYNGEFYQKREFYPDDGDTVYRPQGACSGVIDSRIYIIGGQWTIAGDGAQDRLVEYNVVNTTFYDKGELPTVKTVYCSAVGYNGLLYYFGGRNDLSWTGFNNARDIAYSYDPDTATWTQLASMPTRLCRAGKAVVVNNKIIIVGGESAEDVFETSIKIYDPYTDTWDNNTLPPLNEPRVLMNPVVIGNEIYLSGGVGTDGHVIDTLEKLTIEYTELNTPTSQPTGETADPSRAPTNYPTTPSIEPTNAPSGSPVIAPTRIPTSDPTWRPTEAPVVWNSLADLPEPNHRHCVAAVDDDGLYMWGGFQRDTNFFQDIYYYEISTDTWTNLGTNWWSAKAPYQLGGSYDGVIWAFGGDTVQGDEWKDYNPSTDAKFGRTKDSHGVYVYGAAGGIVDNFFYVCGGIDRDADIVLDVCFRYNMDSGKTRTESATLPNGPRAFASAVGYGDYVYFFGGRDSYDANADADVRYRDNTTDDAYRYDPGTSSFTALAPLPEPTAGAGNAVVFGGKILVVGGHICSAGSCVVSELVMEYDVVNDVWNYLDRLLFPTYNHATVVVANVLYVVGGANSSDISTTRLEALAYRDTVPTFSPTGSPLAVPTQAPSAAPSQPPTSAPTSPSVPPTFSPSNSPTTPTIEPTGSPSQPPTAAPSGSPSLPPTGAPSVSPSVAPTGAPTSLVALYRLNCGESQDTVTGGRLWNSDVPYFVVENTQSDMSEFIDSMSLDVEPYPELFYNNRFGLSDGFYYRNLDLSRVMEYGYPEGDVVIEIVFYFCEIDDGYFGSDERIMNIYADDELIVSGLDVYKEVGSYEEYIITRTIERHTNDSMELYFVATRGDKPIVSAIEIKLSVGGDLTKAPSPPPTAAPTGAPSLPPTPAPTGVFGPFLRINCGNEDENVTVDGEIWLKDDYFTNPRDDRNWEREFSGKSYDKNDLLHRTERYSFDTSKGTNYDFDLMDFPTKKFADYLDEWTVLIDMYFAESQTGVGVGDRVMDIYVNDELVFDDVDIYEQTGDHFIELKLSTVATVPKGDLLNINYVKAFGGSSYCKMDAIQLTLLLVGSLTEFPTSAPTFTPSMTPTNAPTSPPTGAAVAVRINCGSNFTAISDQGIAFDPDADFEVSGNVGSSVLSTSLAVDSNSALNQVARSAPGITYTFDLEELNFYRVVFDEMPLRIKLYFAEIDASVTSAGDRLFDIFINGASYFSNYDIFASAGNLLFTEVVETINLIVPTNQNLIISLQGVGSSDACISAIEVTLPDPDFTTLPPSNAPTDVPSSAPTAMPSVPTRAPTSWFPLDDAPNELVGASAASVDDSGYYVLGGVTSFGFRFRAFKYYNVLTDTWQGLGNVPWYARGEYGLAAAYDNKLYFIGGTGARAHRMKIYDTSSGSWTLDPNTARLRVNRENIKLIHAAGAVVGSHFYVAGGTFAGNAVDYFNVYDLVTPSWTALEPLLGGPRTHASAAGYANKFFIFGGTTSADDTSSDSTTDAYVYDIESGVWSQITPLPEPTASAGQAVVFTDKIVIVGGISCTSGSCALKESVLAYDVSLNTYEYLPHKYTPMQKCAVVGVGNILYAATGSSELSNVANNIHEALELTDAFPTAAPTGAPVDAPTSAPSFSPSDAPTGSPTLPTAAPSGAPTQPPSQSPSNAPSSAPSRVPSNAPVQPPTGSPSQPPTVAPSNSPSLIPSSAPTSAPSNAPTNTQRTYEIDIEIDDKGGSGTTTPLWMMLRGLTRDSAWIKVNDYVDLDTANVKVSFSVTTDDVGNPAKMIVILVKQDGDDFRVNEVAVDGRADDFSTVDLHYDFGAPDYGRGCGWLMVDLSDRSITKFSEDYDQKEWSECPWQPDESSLVLMETIDDTELPSTCGGATYETYSDVPINNNGGLAEAVAMDLEHAQYTPWLGEDGSGLWVFNTTFGAETPDTQFTYEVYQGEGTIAWTGGNYYTYGGAYPLSTKVYLNKAGTYRVLWRTRTADWGESDLHNDAWVRCPDCVRYYGYDVDTQQIACPSYDSDGVYGDSKYNCSTDFGPYQGYFKLQKSECACFNWISTLIGIHGVEHQMRFLIDVDEPGAYTIEISPRSNFFYLDKLVVYMPTTGESFADADLSVSKFNTLETPCLQ